MNPGPSVAAGGRSPGPTRTAVRPAAPRARQAGGTPPPALSRRTTAGHHALGQLALLARLYRRGPGGHLAAGYLLRGRLPDIEDPASYVWSLGWVAHQVTHLGNPWFTSRLAAPAGVQLGYDTLMPLLGLVMLPVTLLGGPA